MTGTIQKMAICFAALGLCAGVSAAHALDISVPAQAHDDPFISFRSGISAYKSGHTREAVESLRYAAELGHTGAKWKLARMYAEGDGVAENDLEAYQFFLKIVEDGVAPGSQNESYVSDALVALGNYTRTGIAGTPVNANPARARSLYTQAATTFANPEAQYQLGRMLLEEGGDKRSRQQAARWFKLAAEKGNPAAQAMFGNILFQRGKTVPGLAMMTAAMEHASAEEQAWIRPLQEHAFALCGEAERRTAISLVADIMANGGLQVSHRK